MSTDFQNIPLHAGVKVLKVCKSGLVAIDKPEGVLAHPNTSEDNARSIITANYSLEEEAYHIRDGAGGIRRVWLINRLDGPTSGVILLATNAEAATYAKALFAQGKVSKAYVAICLGRNLHKLRGIWIDGLVKEGRGSEGVRSFVVRPGVRPSGPVSQAITHFSSGDKGQGALDLVVLNLEPKTGRTHQLRVQCAEHGHPILGDKTYGNFDGNKALGSERGFKRLFLHAASIELTIQCDDKPVRFSASAPLPAEFTAVIGSIKGPVDDKNGLGKVRL
jgi:23S rRNA-/tRNA-specific pseudouridylate synthase